MDLASYQHLKLERLPGGVMLVTLNRPNVLNAAHEAMHSELATIWADLSRDNETRVAVVTGAGRAFSAGGDLSMVERQIGNYDLVTSMLREMSDLVYNMANCEKPIVSAING
jgi:enoyl-CoA hydratase